MQTPAEAVRASMPSIRHLINSTAIKRRRPAHLCAPVRGHGSFGELPACLATGLDTRAVRATIVRSVLADADCSRTDVPAL